MKLVLGKGREIKRSGGKKNSCIKKVRKEREKSSNNCNNEKWSYENGSSKKAVYSNVGVLPVPGGVCRTG